MESKELRRRAAKCEQNDREVDKTPRHALSDDGAALNIAHNNTAAAAAARALIPASGIYIII